MSLQQCGFVSMQVPQCSKMGVFKSLSFQRTIAGLVDTRSNSWNLILIICFDILKLFVRSMFWIREAEGKSSQRK